VRTVPALAWLSQVAVILPAEVRVGSDLTITIALRGTVSNKVTVKIK
jgi:uncharacterized protein (TIGR03437 family)